jgi:hypothetical protein
MPIKNPAAGDNLLDADIAYENVEARRARLREAHVRPLTEWVESVRQRLSRCQAATVCEFDPAGGGTDARILALFQDPSRTASGTGFISPDNNDFSAYKTTLAFRDAGLEPKTRLHWNVYPFWLENPDCPTSASTVRKLCAAFLAELTDERLLPKLTAVVTVGKHATAEWAKLRTKTPPLSSLPAFDIPHPARSGWSKRTADGRLAIEKVREQLALVKAVCKL